MAAGNLKSTKIMVVDDEPALRQILRDELEPFGYEIVTAASGSEALALLRESRVDIVITDARMPNGDGFELMRRISSLEGHSPQVVLVSGFADLSTSEALAAGFSRVWEKPYDFTTIFRDIAELAIGESRRRAR